MGDRLELLPVVPFLSPRAKFIKVVFLHVLPVLPRIRPGFNGGLSSANPFIMAQDCLPSHSRSDGPWTLIALL